MKLFDPIILEYLNISDWLAIEENVIFYLNN